MQHDGTEGGDVVDGEEWARARGGGGGIDEGDDEGEEGKVKTENN